MRSGNVNPIDSVQPCAVLPTDGTEIDTLRAFREPIDGSPEQHKLLGRMCGYEPDYWAKILTGERGVKLDRLGRLPLAVQGEIVRLWAEALGMRIERRDQGSRRAALKALADAVLALAEA